MVHLERRAHRRLNLERPCKLYVPRAARYVTGSTWNLSHTGALVQLASPPPLEPGDRLYVGVALKRRQAVLTASEMVEATIVRVVPTADDGLAVALRFLEEPQQATATTTYRRAA